MKRGLTLPASAAWLVVLTLFLPCLGIAAPAKEFKYEAVLVWATNDEASPDPNHHPVKPDVLKKLRKLPLKWKNYFEVNLKEVAVAKRESKKVVLSDKCTIEVKVVDGQHVEVSLIGQGLPVLKRTQSLDKGEMLVLGGNAPDETGWLVVLKRIE